MNLDEYKKKYDDEASPGWDAIDKRLNAEYDNREPMHWGTAIPMMLGGEDPIDGISAYEAKHLSPPHMHFCSYGFTELWYNEEAAGGDFSRFGFELTFRLAKQGEPSQDDVWVCSLIQNIARYVFESGKWFEPYHWMPANGPIHADCDTELVGLIFVPDPRLDPIDSPHGKVEFLQMYGVTQDELDQLGKDPQANKKLVDAHRAGNPLLITDLGRSTLQG